MYLFKFFIRVSIYIYIYPVDKLYFLFLCIYLMVHHLIIHDTYPIVKTLQKKFSKQITSF